MALTPGVRLGPYEVIAPLGIGGMGEVYRARDTNLNRDVAIKVLLPAVANDPDRLARFSREAQVLASLNHPNIAHIHGLEESNGVKALVMELVEGEDLAQRIARGPIPLDEALPIARQIADALEAAHDHGIIHRDLKPANIKVRPDGTVKVLDFGLAKAVDPTAGSSATAMNSPTLSLHATEAGIILGTAAYMSPEQARGKAVDRRADIWAFGVVLFEMLTGKRAFAGDEISDTLVSVLRDEPAWSALPAETPSGVVQALHVCLRKDPKQRVRDISAVRLSMEGAFDTSAIRAISIDPAHRVPASNRSRLLTAAMLLICAALASGATWALTRSTPAAVQPVRFTVTPSADLMLSTPSPDRDIAISPDGNRLVYQTGQGGYNQSSELQVRAIDQLESVPLLRGLSDARAPFFSPDSRWVGFVGQTTVGAIDYDLKKVSITGGSPIAICRVEGFLVGASWGADDAIVFATTDSATGLLRVPAGGGDPTVLTRPDAAHGEFDHVRPFVMPGGRAVLFSIVPRRSMAGASSLASPGNVETSIAVLDLATGLHKTLIRAGNQAEYFDAPGSADAGYLVYAHGGTLRAVRFDPVRLEILSDPVSVVEQVLTKPNGTAEFSVSRTGAVVYVGGGVAVTPVRSLLWVDRQGLEDALRAPPRSYAWPRLSPDGTTIALDVRDQENDVWLWDLRQATLRRFTFDPGFDGYPVWMPDGRRLIFTSGRSRPQTLYAQQADGTGSAQPLLKGPQDISAYSLTPDGQRLVVREGPLRAYDLSLAHLAGTPRTEPLLHGSFDESNGEISPDGRWLAYQSNETGQEEVYVRPFPNVDGGRWQVSTGGGQPAWARNGRELFYIDARTQALMAVPIDTRSGFSSGTPARMFDAKPYYSLGVSRSYDVSVDGRRFLMIKNAAAAGAGGSIPSSMTMTVVLNWVEELKARVPVATR
jgi:serine/threonine protein kinase